MRVSLWKFPLRVVQVRMEDRAEAGLIEIFQTRQNKSRSFTRVSLRPSVIAAFASYDDFSVYLIYAEETLHSQNSGSTNSVA